MVPVVVDTAPYDARPSMARALRLARECSLEEINALAIEAKRKTKKWFMTALGVFLLTLMTGFSSVIAAAPFWLDGIVTGIAVISGFTTIRLMSNFESDRRDFELAIEIKKYEQMLESKFGKVQS